MVGLTLALAAYQTHEVSSEVPIVLLDSIEEFDSDRIERLVGYIADDVPRVVVSLLPEDASGVEADAEVSADALV